jgi:hypothetical protein
MSEALRSVFSMEDQTTDYYFAQMNRVLQVSPAAAATAG